MIFDAFDGISRTKLLNGRSLGPLIKTQARGMTHRRL
jgi:hypothetical protein